MSCLDPNIVSRGTLVINDGVMGDSSSGGLSSFEVGLSCSQSAISLSGNAPATMRGDFYRTVRRIAPSKNPVGAAKRVVAEYAGDYEASILRKRIIAIARTKISISGEEFRFRL